MTLAKNFEKTINLCKCGQPFQGERWKKHAQKNSEDDTHSLAIRVWFCAICDERKVAEVGDSTSFDHGNCQPYVQLKKEDMRSVVRGEKIKNLASIVEAARKKEDERKETEAEKRKVMAEKVEAREELTKALYSIGANKTLEEMSDITESNDIEESDDEEFPLAKRAKVVTKELEEQPLSHSTPTSEAAAHTQSSTKITPHGLQRQQPWNPRQQSTHPTQARAIDTLQSKLKATQATLKQAMEEREMNKVKKELMKKWEDRVVEVTAKNKELKEIKAELEREVIEMKAAEERRMMDKDREVTSLMEKLGEKAKEVEVMQKEKKKMEEQHMREIKDAMMEVKKNLKPQPMRTILGHLACQSGRLITKRWEEEDLDATSVCFSNPSADIHCHHVKVRTDSEKTSVSAMNMRVATIGKNYDLFVHLINFNIESFFTDQQCLK